jgi:hypothetical protein
MVGEMESPRLHRRTPPELFFGGATLEPHPHPPRQYDRALSWENISPKEPHFERGFLCTEPEAELRGRTDASMVGDRRCRVSPEMKLQRAELQDR